MKDPFLLAVLTASGLLLLGFVARANVRGLQLLFIPASVIGGLIGFILVQFALRSGAADAAALWQGEAEAILAAGQGQEIALGIAKQLGSWPGWLIAVVFAGLLLEHTDDRKPLRQAVGRVARQGIVVWIIVLGQVLVGLALAWGLILPWYDVPGSFGQLIETGFAGGHGTAAAMADVWSKVLEFHPGRDLAFFFATVGLIYGVISGIAMVNLGVRRGWTRAGDVKVPIISGLEPRTAPRPAALARVSNEVIDPFVFQLLIVAVAFAMGYALKSLFVTGASALVPADLVELQKVKAFKAINSIPLFLFTLIGGWLTRQAMRGLGVADLIDTDSIRRVVGAAMEFLIVAAIATLRVETLTQYWLPVLLLLVGGCAWAAFCLLVVARFLLPRAYWFELGLINYGMSTATTAQGLMLLRIVDPDMKSGAAEDYAAAAPLSAPFVGGGIITLSLPVIIHQAGIAVVTLAVAVAMAACCLLGVYLARSERWGQEPR
jgi:ESS family glutamate:Na+ symporter